MLTALISVARPANTSLEVEDIFSTSLGLIFTDDVQNQHGDSDAVILYKSRFGDLTFRTADPKNEEERRKFAHYLWNAGVLMGECVAGMEMRSTAEDGAYGRYADWSWWRKGRWWLTEQEGQSWQVANETVLELGAGVGLGGILSALAGAVQVTITDYPAPEILSNIQRNITTNITAQLRSRVTVQGHQWGKLDTPFALKNADHFTRIIAADCFWMPHEHSNLGRSMLHFLSRSPAARILVISGFHTGRKNLTPFFVETVPEHGLAIEDIWEMHISGERRPWAVDLPEEPIGERKKWVVLARLKRAE